MSTCYVGFNCFANINCFGRDLGAMPPKIFKLLALFGFEIITRFKRLQDRSLILLFLANE